MARKPNYRFERFERDRAKAAKKAAKAEARALRKAERDGTEGDEALDSPTSAEEQDSPADDTQTPPSEG